MGTGGGADNGVSGGERHTGGASQPAAVRGSSPIILLLRRHGLSAAAAAQLASAGSVLRARTVREGVEFGATFDADTGVPVGGILRGAGRDVDFAPHAAALQPGRRYAALHTHPANTPPSHRDAGLLPATSPLHALVVVGADGRWYLLSRVSGQPQANLGRTGEAFAAALMALRLRVLAQQTGSGWSDQETLVILLHNIWRRIAPMLGLRYDVWQPPRAPAAEESEP